MIEHLIERLIREGKTTQVEIDERIAEIQASVPEPEPSMEMMIAITELAEMQLDSTFSLESAITELAEIVLGGME